MAEFHSDKFLFARFTLSAARCAGSGTLYLPQWQFRIILQGDIPNQRALIFDIAAITAGAKIIVHTAQKFHIVWRIPAIHLLADIPVPIPQQGHRIIPIIGGSRIWLPMIRSVILGVLRRLLLILGNTA